MDALIILLAIQPWLPLLPPAEPAPPPRPPEPKTLTWQLIRYPLQLAWMHAELLDARECKYTLVNAHEFKDDIAMLKGREADMASAPPLSEVYLLPDRVTLNALCTFNRHYREAVEFRHEVGPHRAKTWAQLTAIDHEFALLDAARDAQCEYYFVTVRRAALKRLRELEK